MLNSLDKFRNGIPEEFDEVTMRLWTSAKEMAEQEGYRFVHPWDFLAAWLRMKDAAPHGCSWLALRDAINRIVRGGPPSSNSRDLPPCLALAEAFGLSVADSFRFGGSISRIDHRWIIPNLLPFDSFVMDRVSRMGIAPEEFLRATLDLLGPPFPELRSTYIYRLKPPPWRNHVSATRLKPSD